MSQLRCLFAWSSYVNGKPVYNGVFSDYSILKMDNWELFYSATRCYCPYDKQIFYKGYLTANEDAELFTHKEFSKVFTIAGNKLIPVNESEISYYPYDATESNESAAFRNHCAYVG